MLEPLSLSHGEKYNREQESSAHLTGKRILFFFGCTSSSWLSPVAASGGYSPVAVRVLLMASLAVEHGL